MSPSAKPESGSPADLLEAEKSLIGVPLRVEQWNHEATRDAIRHYAWGIGDDNPLYSDPDYAARTRYKSIVAPPTFPYSVYEGVVAPGLDGYTWFYAGADWTFHRPVLRNDEIVAGAQLHSIKELEGKRVSHMFLQTGKIEYCDPQNRPFATLMSHCFRVPQRKDGTGGMPFQHRSEHVYSDKDLASIERMVLNEYRRGSDRLSWADVAIGDEIPTIARGPLMLIDMTTYYSGAIGTAGYKSTKMRWIYRDRALHNPEALPNTLPPAYFTEGLTASMGHSDPKAASRTGMPGAYDNGLQRTGFMTSAVTNWMGDDAFLREMSVRIKAPVIFGDTTFVKGKVGAKEQIADRGLMTLEIWAENQFGEVTATGKATVEIDLS